VEWLNLRVADFDPCSRRLAVVRSGLPRRFLTTRMHGAVGGDVADQKQLLRNCQAQWAAPRPLFQERPASPGVTPRLAVAAIPKEEGGLSREQAGEDKRGSDTPVAEASCSRLKSIPWNQDGVVAGDHPLDWR
jgi:hypothetical protein